MGSLFVTAGPNKGELFPLAAPDAVIGRDPGCSFQLTDSRVSRQHFRIVTDPQSPISPGPVIIDLGSVNGTLLNGARLAAPTPLKDGDTIALGNSTLRFASRQLAASPEFFSMQHIPKPSESYKQTLPGPAAP